MTIPMDFKRDPITQSIYNDLKRGIVLTIENKCHLSALSLIFCGIDILTHLGRPPDQPAVLPEDFASWTDRFIRLPGKTAITGEEWYSARCAVLHTFGVESRRTKAGSARKVAFVVGGHPPVSFDSKVNKTLVLMDIPTLAQSFYEAIDLFLINSFSDKEKRKLIESRLPEMLISLPGKREGASA